MSAGDEEKKIIIDEDWKERVRREKEQVGPEPTEPEPAASAAAAAPQGSAPEGSDAGPLPPASFTSLVSMIATQALMCLGQMPGPTGEPLVDLEQAKHLIDLLAVLEEKTQGNLSAEEAELLNGMLHQLRMGYIAIKG